MVLEGVASGLSIGAAARRAGIRSRNVIYQWKKADPTFAADIEDAFETGTDRLADIAMQRALMPDPRHDALLMFMLRSRDPARFNRKMLDAVVVGDSHRPITVSHEPTNTDEVQPGVRLVIVGGDEDARSFTSTPTPATIESHVTGDTDSAADTDQRLQKIQS